MLMFVKDCLGTWMYFAEWYCLTEIKGIPREGRGILRCPLFPAESVLYFSEQICNLYPWALYFNQKISLASHWSIWALPKEIKLMNLFIYSFFFWIFLSWITCKRWIVERVGRSHPISPYMLYNSVSAVHIYGLFFLPVVVEIEAATPSGIGGIRVGSACIYYPTSWNCT